MICRRSHLHAALPPQYLLFSHPHTERTALHLALLIGSMQLELFAIDMKGAAQEACLWRVIELQFKIRERSKDRHKHYFEFI